MVFSPVSRIVGRHARMPPLGAGRGYHRVLPDIPYRAWLLSAVVEKLMSLKERTLSSQRKGFLEELAGIQQKEKQCGLKDALRSMDPELRAEVREALKSDSGWHSTTISTVLKKKSYRVNEWQVRNCRKNCECGELVPDTGAVNDHQ